MVTMNKELKDTPGAIVEVIGHDDVAALKRLSLKIRDQVRLEFHPMDKLGQQELYQFMHQDPSRPNPVIILPPPPAAAWGH